MTDGSQVVMSGALEAGRHVHRDSVALEQRRSSISTVAAVVTRRAVPSRPSTSMGVDGMVTLG